MAERVISLLDTPYYDFLHRDLKRIIHLPSNGDTRVRFVSKAIRHRNDQLMRHVSIECIAQNNVIDVFEKNGLDLTYGQFRDEFCVTLPNVTHTIADIRDYEETLPKLYVIGLQDCRHHASNILKFCYPLE